MCEIWSEFIEPRRVLGEVVHSNGAPQRDVSYDWLHLLILPDGSGHVVFNDELRQAGIAHVHSIDLRFEGNKLRSCSFAFDYDADDMESICERFQKLLESRTTRSRIIDKVGVSNAYYAAIGSMVQNLISFLALTEVQDEIKSTVATTGKLANVAAFSDLPAGAIQQMKKRLVSASNALAV